MSKYSWYFNSLSPPQIFPSNHIYIFMYTYITTIKEGVSLIRNGGGEIGECGWRGHGGIRERTGKGK